MHLPSTIGSTMSARPAHSARTLALLQAPVLPTLLRLAGPNVLVMLAQASTGLIEAHFIGRLGTPALAGMALVKYVRLSVGPVTQVEWTHIIRMSERAARD